MSELDILRNSRCWRCKPWDYNSVICLKFEPGGRGNMIYAYGQRVYALINTRFHIPSAGLLQLSYQKSPPYPGSKGYVPEAGIADCRIRFSLEEGDFRGVEANVGPSTYHWKLMLDTCPFPPELNLPPIRRVQRREGDSEVDATVKQIKLPDPLVFFGHVSYPEGHPYLSKPKPVSLWKEIKGLIEFLRPK